ncbi:nuclease-related domain-containing protein [Nonomuraea sp. NPDC026600]|uniref:nuclease-related domain-containing protein n=1 Tax=Nonomuraea sp. NPDC026600 TaxID=3155363 RepID=UPI0033C17D4E
MVRPASSVPWLSNGAGASAHARYRALWRAGRRERLVLRAVMAAIVGIGGTLVVGWRVGLALAVLVVAADMVFRWRSHEAVRTWRRGALGERRTARRLQELELTGYLVLHDRALPRGRANVDHLAVGPAGVFVIDSKQWRRDKRITRRGRTVRTGHRWTPDEVRSALYESQSVAQALTALMGRRVEVTPVIAVHGLHVPFRGLRVADAQVLRASMVPSWILRRPARLDRATVSRLKAAAAAAFPAYAE